MPDRLSSVDSRSSSPLWAIGVMLVLSIASTAIYAFTTWFTSLSALLGLTLPLLITAVAGILLPFRRRELVENSPYNRRLGGIPLLSHRRLRWPSSASPPPWRCSCGIRAPVPA